MYSLHGGVSRCGLPVYSQMHQFVLFGSWCLFILKRIKCELFGSRGACLFSISSIYIVGSRAVNV